MARKSIGYVKLEWVCPNCNTKNPGPQKTCLACGHPQPENVVFNKAGQDVLVSDQKELDQAKLTADVHCPYCGTRNTASAKICTQCGGDLTGAQARQSGQIVGAYQDKAKTVTCPNCSSENPSFASFCTSCGASLTSQGETPQQQTAPLPAQTAQRKFSPVLIILPIIFVVAIIVIIITLSSKKTDISAIVENTHWIRSIIVQEYGPVSNTDWISNIPEGAQIGDCRSEYHHTSSQPEPSSTEVCGTPYVVDKGSGYGEVVTDCVYEIYQDRCEYTSNQWYTLTTLTLDGTDQSSTWPETNLTSSQREGDRSEQYTITFDAAGEAYTYTTNSYSEYLEYKPGTAWLLTVNAFGRISEISPAD